MYHNSFVQAVRGQSRALLTAAVLAFLPGAVAAQEGSITGTVVDGSSMRPLDAVQVFVEGTSLGTLTNSSGRYLLLDVPVGEVTVSVDRVGYGSAEQTVTVADGETAQLDFELSTSAVQLDELVITGAGQATERRRLGNTVSAVDMERLQDAPTANFSEQLQGRTAGVSVSQSGGMAGEASEIRIRGTSSLTQSNNPIIYVDGIRVSNDVDDGDAGAASRLDDINPESIERVEILKGAAAATLYGTEASNGVIQIFTKGGEAGDPQWEMTLENGFSQMDMDRYADHSGFVCSPAGSALWPGGGCTQAHADAVADWWGLGSLDLYEVFDAPLLDPLFETGYNQAYSLSVRGGSESINYYVSGRYAHEDGAFGGEHWGPAQDIDEQKQATANLTFFPIEDLRLRFSSMYTERYHEVPTNGNNTTGTFSMSIMAKPELARESNPTGTGTFATIREMFNIEQFEETKRFAGSVNTQYNPLEGLTLEGTVGVDIVSSEEIDFQRFGWNVDDFANTAPEGNRNFSTHNRRNITLDAKAVYDNDLTDNITSSFIVGAQVLQNEYHENFSGGFAFPAPGLEVTGAASEPSAGESVLQEVNAGVYVQEQIGLNNFIFTTLGARYDKHSAFGETAGGALYPKLSMSVVPTDRAGVDGIGPFSSVRLRGAIGQSGLQPGAFDQFTTFAPVPSVDGPGVGPDNLGNEDLKPEVSTEWEVGGDFGILDNRFSLDATYWNRTVSDVLVPRQFPPSGGFTSTQLFNLGEMKATGFEFGLNGTVFNTANASFDMFVNASRLEEEVTDMGDAPSIKVGYYRYRTWIVEGHAPGSFFSRMIHDPAEGETAYDNDGDGQPDSESELRQFFVDNPSVNPDNLSFLPATGGEGPDGEFFRGKPLPDWSGSFGGTLSFLGSFRLTSQFDYAFGNFHRQNLSGEFRDSHWLLGRNTRETAEIEATLVNPDASPDEKVAAANEWREHVGLSPWDGTNKIEEADYIRFRELGLTYQVPGSAVEGLGIDRLTVTAAGRNLALWTKYSGIDPESNVVTSPSGDTSNFVYGIDGWRPGSPTRYTFSLRIGF